jgi:hypothetical protein
MLKKIELKIPSEPPVFVDSKTNARSIALPFRLPDGTSAVAIITKLKDDTWIPQKEIKSLVINYL